MIGGMHTKRPAEAGPLARSFSFFTRADDDPNPVTCRAATLPRTLNTEERTLECVIATEDPTRVYDWASRRVILETLLVEGAVADDQVPLIRDHSQYSSTSILGSVTNTNARRDELHALLTFGKDLNETAEGIWRTVEQGHLTRVSVGYGYGPDDYVTIEPGKSRKVKGRTFTAPENSALRVVFRWYLREVSTVVIPADARAKMRDGGTGISADQESGFPDGNPNQPTSHRSAVNELLKFLRKHGLSADVTDNAEALRWAADNLGRGHFTALGEICTRHEIAEYDAAQFAVEPVRTTPTTPTTSTTPGTPTEPTRTAPVQTVEQALAAERQRTAGIRRLCDEFSVTDAIRNEMIDGDTTIDQARERVLEFVRTNPTPAAPNIHVAQVGGLRAFQAALMERQGITPDSEFLRSPIVDSVIGRQNFNADWLRGARSTGARRDEVEQAFETASQRGMRGASMGRLCEELIRLEGGVVPYNQQDLIERSFASANFNALFGTIVHLMMVKGYEETPDTYERYCRVIDVPDFRPNKEATMGNIGGMKRQGANGGRAANLNVDEPTFAEVAAERFAGVLKVTDQVIINDSFAVVDTFAPSIGEAARQIPNDIALSILLGNPDLSDGDALFLLGQSLIQNGTLDEDGLTAALTLLKAKEVNGRRITVNEALLMTGLSLSTKAKKVVRSTTTNGGDDNVLQGVATHLEESALSLGVDDPRTDPVTRIAAKPNSYFVFAAPSRSLVMAFRQGTNRGPITRSTTLDKGEWGVAWDVFLDVGGAATGRIGVVEVRL